MYMFYKYDILQMTEHHCGGFEVFILCPKATSFDLLQALASKILKHFAQVLSEVCKVSLC